MFDRVDASALKQSVKVRRMLGEPRLHITEVTVSLCASTFTRRARSVLPEMGSDHARARRAVDGCCLGWRGSILLFSSKHFLLTAHCQEQWSVKRAADLRGGLNGGLWVLTAVRQPCSLTGFDHLRRNGYTGVIYILIYILRRV